MSDSIYDKVEKQMREKFKESEEAPLGYKFIKEPYDSLGETAPNRVQIELHQDASISDMLETFELFLKASGYHFDGHLDLVEDEE